MQAALCAVLYAALVVYALEFLKRCRHCRWMTRDTTGITWLGSACGASLGALWLCNLEEPFWWTVAQQLILQQLIFDGIVRRGALRGPYRS